MNEDHRVRDKLLSLGDPSGRQDCAYWNDWFAAVCYDDNSSSSFEWYCDADSVSRILSRYLQDRSELLLFHPGSGNSTLPVHLRDQALPGSRQIIMDISDLVISQMEQLYSDNNRNDLQFIVGNVLNQPLPFADNTFDAWVDKGLTDALFSEKPTHLQQCHDMMLEAHRVLKASCNKRQQPFYHRLIQSQDTMEHQSGLLCIVTMAQSHSLDLILKNWFNHNQLLPLWNTHLHIYEIEPSTGNRRPFVFVLQKYNILTKVTDEDNNIDTRLISLYTTLQQIHTIAVQAYDDDLLTRVQQLLDTSRQTWIDQHTANTQRKVFTKLEIKPGNDGVDLHVLHDLITNPKTSWGLDSLSWYPTSAEDTTESHLRILSQTKSPEYTHMLKYGYIQDIGYGISKLVLACTIASDDLDNLPETLLDSLQFDSSHDDAGNLNQLLETTSDDDKESLVQSIDIDWDSTIAIGDMKHVVKRHL